MIEILDQQTRSWVLVITTILVAISAATKPARAHHHKGNHCQSSCGNKNVPYPFGFSQGCPIQLQCNSSSFRDITIGDFQVLNITQSGILIKFPGECNRPIEKIQPLFQSSYAISSRNNLLLQDCRKSLDGCVVPTWSMEGLINGSHCDDASRSGNLSCYAKGFMQGSSPPVFDTICYGDINWTECKSVFSSFAVSADMVSLQFQRLELEWWIDGGCNQSACDKDANCVDVRLSDGGKGFRCNCNDGFDGDGFPAGNGCRGGRTASDEEGGEVDWMVVFAVLGFVVGIGAAWLPLLFCKTWRCTYFRFLNSMRLKLDSAFISIWFGLKERFRRITT